jgi:predicted metal-dependent phosphotriesterase family hydrolase
MTAEAPSGPLPRAAVQTVLGPVPAADLGIVSAHEHLARRRLLGTLGTGSRRGVASSITRDPAGSGALRP